MPRIPTSLSRFSLAVGLVGVLPALSSDQDVRAEVQHPIASRCSTDDPDVAAFKLRFGIRLTNRSEKPLNLPKSEIGGDETTRATILSAESKHPDGAWTYLGQATWIDDGKIKYELCTSLRPGGTAEIGNLPERLVLLKKQLADLGREPTVRFGIWLFCRQTDGKVVTTAVTTDAFTLLLPDVP